jgi:hypothetical protein
MAALLDACSVPDRATASLLVRARYTLKLVIPSPKMPTGASAADQGVRPTLNPGHPIWGK